MAQNTVTKYAKLPEKKMAILYKSREQPQSNIKKCKIRTIAINKMQ